MPRIYNDNLSPWLSTDHHFKLNDVACDVVRTEASINAGIDWQMLRLDQIDEHISGNKLFKLLPYLRKARRQHNTTLLSFGGMHSNHLYALAHAGKRWGFNTVAVVRGYKEQADTPTLNDIKNQGMRIHYANREEYAKRYDAAYHQSLMEQYPNSLVINEGGAGELGIQGAVIMADVIVQQLTRLPDTIFISAGTGTSLLGLLNHATLKHCHIAAVAALHNMQALTTLAASAEHAHWRIIDGYQCGGFAKVNRELLEFWHRFEQEQGIALDPVYTAKMCFAIDQQIKQGMIKAGSRILSVHTGGLQGRRILAAKLDGMVMP